MLIVAIGIAIIACVGFWMVGGVLLRAAGLVVAALAALNLALVGNAAAILLFVVGSRCGLSVTGTMRCGAMNTRVRWHDASSIRCFLGVSTRPAAGGLPSCLPNRGKNRTRVIRPPGKAGPRSKAGL